MTAVYRLVVFKQKFVDGKWVKLYQGDVMALKFDSCVSCQVCFWNAENSSSLCERCNGEDAFIPIEQDDIDNMKLALKTENSKVRFYLDLNQVLTRVNHEQDIECLAEADQPA